MTISNCTKRILSITITCLVLVFISAQSSYAQSQAGCHFACNDTINVSVNRNCEATLTADMILEDAGDCDDFTIVLKNSSNRQVGRLSETGQYTLITRDLVGQFLTAEVTLNGSRTNCWAYVKIEDKLPPEIVCPENDTIRCDATDYGANNASLETYLENLLESTLIDNCDNEEIMVNVTRNQLSTSCVDTFTAVRYIEFDALDNQANATSCAFEIYYQKTPAGDIDAPKNYTEDMVLECTDNFPLVEGRPYPTVEYLLGLDGDLSVPNINGNAIADLIDGQFITDNLCNFMISYDDQEFPSCGGSYKIVRTWLVTDWCDSGNSEYYYQVIKVVDNEIIITDVPDDIELQANPSTCEASTSLLRPTVSGTECSGWTWAVSVQLPGETEFTEVSSGLVGSGLVYTFPLGESTVRYTVTDDCDNMDSEDITVTVSDLDEPMAVCDLRTVVTLNDEFTAKVFALTFDDGSFDGCSDITYQVRRMDLGCSSDLLYGDFVKFCCEDLGKIVMVELKITDENGLMSTCMAEVVVQYKNPLIQVACPLDPPVFDCRRFEDFNPNILQRPVITTENDCIGDLNPEPIVTNESLDECGNGFKSVDWVISFNGADTVICSNLLTFQNLDLFEEQDITWPANRSVSSCDDLAPTQAEIDNLIPNTVACGNVIYSEPQDKIFDNISGACIKVLRTWTVVDWCQYPDNPSAIWKHVQTIIVYESEAPAFAPAVANVDITYNTDACNALVTLNPLASDDCTSDGELEWSYTVQLISGASMLTIIPETDGKDIVNTFDNGSYIATWTVTDHCGNATSESVEFSVVDNRGPEAICNPNVTKNINPDTEQAILSVSDINNSPQDACSANMSIGIRRAGTDDILAQNILFGCDEVGEIAIELVVTDENNVSDNCITTVTIADPTGVCNQGVFDGSLPCGYTMHFDGTDDYISVPDLDITSEFTVELLINPESFSESYTTLIEFGQDNPFIGLQNGVPTIFGQIIGDEAIALDTWTHLAFTYSPSQNRSVIYVNGVAIKTGAATSSFIGEGMGIGYHDGDGYFHGSMEEVRIWDYSRSAEEVGSTVGTILFGDESGLTAYYDFNAVAGVLIDKGPNQLNGQLNGTAGSNALPQFVLATIDCPDSNNGAAASVLVGGHIYTPDDVSVESATLSLEDRGAGSMSYHSTDVEGEYAFESVPKYKNYQLKADKTDDYTNGISTLDLILIQMHILGLDPIEDPYKLIAADANNNQSISSIDLVQLRQLILGITDELPNQSSWVFLNKEKPFLNANDPWSYNTEADINTDADGADQDFIGIKIGDINGSAVANSLVAGTRSYHEDDIEVKLRQDNDGDYIDFVTATAMDLRGLQMIFPLDILDGAVEDGWLQIEADDYHINDEGLKLSYADVEVTDIPRGEVLFSVKLKANTMIDLPEHVFVSAYNEWYDGSLSVRPFAMTMSSVYGVTNQVELYQNKPNPFTEMTSIQFYLGHAESVNFEVYGLNGARIYQSERHYDKGMNEININRSELGLNKGIYYYQIKTQSRYLVRKMIVI